MKKLLPIVLVLIIIAAGAYFLTNYLGKLKDSAQEAISGSLAMAVERGVPMKCSYTVEGVEYEGYVKGEMWRGKMRSPEGQAAEVIIKDNCMWSWTVDEEATGIKTCFEPTETEETIWEIRDFYDSDINYYCVPTIVSDDLFNPPGDVFFIDINEDQIGL